MIVHESALQKMFRIIDGPNKCSKTSFDVLLSKRMSCSNMNKDVLKFVFKVITRFLYRNQKSIFFEA